MKIYKHGTVLVNGNLEKLDIAAEHGKITEMKDVICPAKDDETTNCTGKFILPALIDIHTHGAAGYDFNLANSDEMRKILDFYISHGVGTVLPTVMTDSDEVICRQLALIAELAKDYPEIKGIHLEGPFLSQTYPGAMPVRFLQNADTEKFMMYQNSAKGMIKLITVAPEVTGAEKFISEVTRTGVVVSLGHSAADYETTERCIKAGAKSFTHTLNAMKPLDRHNANIAGTALLSDNYCELICDGRHVSQEVVKLIFKAKGADKVIGITDSIMAAGLGDGQYRLGVNDVTVKGADAFITGTETRAGSTLTADSGLANIIAFTGLPLAKAIKCVTENPAKLLGIFSRVGSIAVGKDADFLILG